MSINLPPPFAVPQNPSEDQYNVALLDFVTAPGSSLPWGVSILPCTIYVITQVCSNLALLDKDPWLKGVRSILRMQSRSRV